MNPTANWHLCRYSTIIKNALPGLLTVAAAFLAKSINAQLSTRALSTCVFNEPLHHHVELRPGQEQADLEDRHPDYTVKPLFTLSFEWPKELSQVEPDLPDLTLWYCKRSSYRWSQAPGFFRDPLGKDGIITDVVIPKISPPPVQVKVAPAVTPYFIFDPRVISIQTKKVMMRNTHTRLAGWECIRYNCQETQLRNRLDG